MLADDDDDEYRMREVTEVEDDFNLVMSTVAKDEDYSKTNYT